MVDYPLPAMPHAEDETSDVMPKEIVDQYVQERLTTDGRHRLWLVTHYAAQSGSESTRQYDRIDRNQR